MLQFFFFFLIKYELEINFFIREKAWNDSQVALTLNLVWVGPGPLMCVGNMPKTNEALILRQV